MVKKNAGQRLIPSADKSVLLILNKDITVDEKTPINFYLKTAENIPIPGRTVSFKSSLSGENFDDVTEGPEGTYKTRFSSTQSGTHTITVLLDNIPFLKEVVNVNPGDLDNDRSSLIASPEIIVANGIERSIVTLTLEDKYGNPVPKNNVVIETNLGDLIQLRNFDWVYSAYLTSIKAGNATISAKVDGKVFKNVNITLNPGIVNGERSILTTDSEKYKTYDLITLSARLRDTYDNIITGDSAKAALYAATPYVPGGYNGTTAIIWRLKNGTTDVFEANAWSAIQAGKSYSAAIKFSANNIANARRTYDITANKDDIFVRICTFTIPNNIMVNNRLFIRVNLFDTGFQQIKGDDALDVLNHATMSVPGAILAESSITWTIDSAGTCTTLSWEAAEIGERYLAELNLGNNKILMSNYYNVIERIDIG
ncbi:invasin-like protein [Grimontella sp. AG753]|nr:invasin-like protein [Grimontella sp. AG753]